MKNKRLTAWMVTVVLLQSLCVLSQGQVTAPLQEAQMHVMTLSDGRKATIQNGRLMLLNAAGKWTAAPAGSYTEQGGRTYIVGKAQKAAGAIGAATPGKVVAAAGSNIQAGKNTAMLNVANVPIFKQQGKGAKAVQPLAMRNQPLKPVHWIPGLKLQQQFNLDQMGSAGATTTLTPDKAYSIANDPIQCFLTFSLAQLMMPGTFGIGQWNFPLSGTAGAAGLIQGTEAPAVSCFLSTETPGVYYFADVAIDSTLYAATTVQVLMGSDYSVQTFSNPGYGKDAAMHILFGWVGKGSGDWFTIEVPGTDGGWNFYGVTIWKSSTAAPGQ